MRLTTRRRNIVSGLCAIVLMAGLTTVGVQYSFGAFDDGYELVADFAAAGQGLVEGSDVKMRGLNVGRVQAIELVDGRARVTMFIDAGREIPVRTSSFTIRPKTLFGEKFIGIEPGADEATGPYFGDDDFVPTYFDPGVELPPGTLGNLDGTALRTAGGFELEQVLEEAYPILQAVEPSELVAILGTLAEAGDGLGPTINRAIVNTSALLDISARRSAETQQFLHDLAALSETFAAASPALVAGAADLNVALPALTDDPAALDRFLREAASLSEDLSDLLEANAPFIGSVYGDGQAVLDTLYAQRNQIVPLVVGIRLYAETVGGAARIPTGNGSLMAAVKGLLGGDLCGPIPCSGAAAPVAPLPPLPLPPVPLPPLPPLPLPPIPIDQSGNVNGQVSSGSDAIIDLVGGGLGGPR